MHGYGPWHIDQCHLCNAQIKSQSSHSLRQLWTCTIGTVPPQQIEERVKAPYAPCSDLPLLKLEAAGF